MESEHKQNTVSYIHETHDFYTENLKILNKDNQVQKCHAYRIPSEWWSPDKAMVAFKSF